MMKSSLFRAALAFMALPMSLASGLAQANPQSDLQRVEISGQRPAELRYDVRKVCTSMEESLARHLAAAMYREGRSADMRVEFKLRGTEISEVRSTGHAGYKTPIRRAVNSLDCGSDRAGEQNFAFMVSFISEEDAAASPGKQRVAISEIARGAE